MNTKKKRPVIDSSVKNAKTMTLVVCPEQLSAYILGWLCPSLHIKLAEQIEWEHVFFHQSIKMNSKSLQLLIHWRKRGLALITPDA